MDLKSKSDSHGRRWVGALLVLLTLGLLAVNLIPERYPLAAPRLALFDAYQSLLPRERLSDPVVIVQIDEAELAALGQWPWPRQFVAALIDAIAAAEPSAIGMDMFFPEADRASPGVVAEARPDLPQAVRQAMAAAPSNDQLLATSIATAPLVLGAAGFDYALPGGQDPLRLWPIETPDLKADSRLRHYPHALASLPLLQRAARGQALLTSEFEGGVARRVALLTSVRGQLAPGLALEMLRVAHGGAPIRLETDALGITGARVGDRLFPTQPDGQAWVHFTRHQTELVPAGASGKLNPRLVSALAILRGEVPDGHLRGKLVLVGLTAIGLQDTVATPLGDRRPGVEVHAQLLESHHDGRHLLRPAFMPWIEAGALVLAGLLLVWRLPLLGANGALGLALGITAGFAATGLALFHWQAWLFDAAGPAALSMLIFAAMMARAFDLSLRQRRQAQADLQAQREAQARVAGELEAARRIQLGSLPRASEAFPGERRFEIDALLEPAREIGGDLYDFYMLDARRMLFLVGDVSGKGLPASLFMAVAKALSKSIALRADASADGVVASIVAALNAEMSRENRESLFVTLLAGVLDLDSGMLEICNAGHDAPYLAGQDGSVVQLEGERGPPLCVIDGYAYGATRTQLAKGDRVCLISDGVSEAMNEAGDMLGGTRVLQALRRAGPGAHAMVTSARDCVRAFVQDAPASDDLTLLAVQWNGPQQP